jgi:hypothetical protein
LEAGVDFELQLYFWYPQTLACVKSAWVGRTEKHPTDVSPSKAAAILKHLLFVPLYRKPATYNIIWRVAVFYAKTKDN